MRRFGQVWFTSMIVVILPIALACGGIWSKAVAKSFAEQAVDLEALPNDANRQALEQVLIDGYVHAADGDIGLSETIDFEIQFESALADGTLDAREVKGLQEIEASWTGGPSSKRTAHEVAMDSDKQEVRAERALMGQRASSRASGGTEDFADWSYPEDLRDRVVAQGMATPECEYDKYDGLMRSTCIGPVGDDYVAVEVYQTDKARYAKEDVQDMTRGGMRRDGAHVFESVHYDQAESKKVAEGVFGIGKDDMGVRTMKKALAELGHGTDPRCDDTTEDEYRVVSCEVYGPRWEIEAEAYIEAGSSEREAEWSFGEYGIAENGLSVSIEAVSVSKGKAFASAFFGSD